MSNVTGPLLGVFDTNTARLIGITQNGGTTDITYIAGQDAPTPSGSLPVTSPAAGPITQLYALTQAAYEAIVIKDPATLYVITD